MTGVQTCALPISLAGRSWRAKSGRRVVPGIYKCFSSRPDVLRPLMEFSDRLHFSEGHLTRRMKEAIATYISAINHCPY